MEEKIVKIVNEMAEYLNISQMKKLQEGYNIIWLYYLFDIMKPIFLQERQGVRQKNLSLSKIKEFEVPFAAFELQEQFAAFVEQADKSKVV